MNWWSKHFPGTFCPKGGLHDWEYLEVKHTAQVKAEAIAEMDNTSPLSLRVDGELHKPYKRVCLQCARVENRISELKREFKAKEAERRRRDARAKELTAS